MASRSMSAASESSSPSSPCTSSHASGCDSNTVSPAANGDPPTTPRDVGGDDVLHLHRFHHEQLLPPPDTIAGRHVDAHDRALHRRPDDRGAVGRLVRDDGTRRRVGALAVVEHRERVATVELGARQPPGRVARAAVVPLGMVVASEEEIDMVVDEASSSRRRRRTPGGLQPGSAGTARFVPTPSMRTSHSARYRRAAASASDGDGEWTTILAGSESKRGLVRVAGVDVACRTRTPGPPGGDPRGRASRHSAWSIRRAAASPC